MVIPKNEIIEYLRLDNNLVYDINNISEELVSETILKRTRRLVSKIIASGNLIARYTRIGPGNYIILSSDILMLFDFTNIISNGYICGMKVSENKNSYGTIIVGRSDQYTNTEVEFYIINKNEIREKKLKRIFGLQ